MENKNLETPVTLLNKPSKIVLIFYACFCMLLVDFWRPVNIYEGESVFDNPEIVSYYSYLPTHFISSESLRTPYTTKSMYIWNRANAVGKLSNGLPARNYGMAILYAPSFFAAQLSSDAKICPSGYSQAHSKFIHWGALIYVFLGLVMLRKFLLAYFDETTTAIVLFLSVFGTILFYYTFIQSELPECHLFFLFAAFLRLTQKWHAKPGWLLTVLIGITLAVISLIYVSDIYILLFFIFWNATDKISLHRKLTFLKRHAFHIVSIFGIILLLWIPQLIFNYQNTGKLFYYTPQSEFFDFSDSKIYTVLFSYSFGWLTYSPIILLAFGGILFMKKNLPISPITLLFIILLALLITGAWRGTEYYGARKLCASIAWLSLPLGAILSKAMNPAVLNNRAAISRIVICFFFLSCIFINIGTSYRVKEQLIIPDQTTEDLYWEYFKSYKLPDNVYKRK